MATSVNSITGNLQRTKGATNPYREGWDRIFAKKEEEKECKCGNECENPKCKNKLEKNVNENA